MKNEKVIQVLFKCRKMINILKLYKLNVSNILSFDNLNTFLVTIPVLLNIYTFILLTWFLFDHGFILSEISFTMPIFLGSCQILHVTFQLITRKKTVYDAVDHLQTLIEKRNIAFN